MTHLLYNDFCIISQSLILKEIEKINIYALQIIPRSKYSYQFTPNISTF